MLINEASELQQQEISRNYLYYRIVEIVESENNVYF